MDYQKDPSVVVSHPRATRCWLLWQKIVKQSTKGWASCCKWKNSSTSLQKLSSLKESHPFQVAEFVFVVQIADEPAFNCNGYHKHTPKNGNELPMPVEKAYVINCTTGNTFWCDEIEKEMQNVCVAFDVIGDSAVPLPDHQYICCHMIFDVKIEDCHCKAQLEVGGHVMKALANLTYASVMSQETAHIALLLAALNNIDA
ncbi:hypothetical protein ACHAW6_009466 [Cyclotella cf. meneghiniana]